jgi:hypothetical protein
MKLDNLEPQIGTLIEIYIKTEINIIEAILRCVIPVVQYQ